MTNTSDRTSINDLLMKLDINPAAAEVYIELLRNEMTHLELSRTTGLNRTKIYRVVDDLESLGLVSKINDDQGYRLRAADPSNLEVLLVNRENDLKKQRGSFEMLLPKLEQLKSRQGADPDEFKVLHYDGVDGFKQMLWNELKTKGEMLILGSCSIEDLIGSTRWSENHRRRTLDASYRVREIGNLSGNEGNFTKVKDFYDVYEERILDRDFLDFSQTIAIYNDTVSTYHWQSDKKAGFEVVNRGYAKMMRATFSEYWNIAKTYEELGIN